VSFDVKQHFVILYAFDLRMSFHLSVNENNNIIKVQNAFSEDSVYEFPYTGRTVGFTVPTSGTYKIEAWGARGGSQSSTTGPLGAYSKSYVLLNKDETIQILVGEKGNTGYGSYNYCGGGGGGTFIAKGNAPLCVAGGGGGFSYQHYSSVDSHACGQSTQLSAGYGTGQASLKMGGKRTQYSSGGGGFVGNGEDTSTAGYGKGGISFLNGGTKQTQGTTRNCAYGGFGGGASNHGECGWGAGGGGYTGGSGGGGPINGVYPQGGGGGSYFEGNLSSEALSLAISGCESRIPPNPGTNGNGFAILTLLKYISNDIQGRKLSCYFHCYRIQFLWTLYTLILQ
jgi:hypothetical protein